VVEEPATPARHVAGFGPGDRPESAERFLGLEVIKGGKMVAHFRTRAEADQLGGAARVEDKSMRVQDRILVELLEWTTELYGGGNDRPTTPSSGSSRASRRLGR
jgi:hypothetical protein